MDEWQAQSMRLVWFGGGLEAIVADKLFTEAFAIEAETVQRNRVPGPANPFWGTAGGRLNDNLAAELQIQPGRVDVILMPVGSGETASLGMNLSEPVVFYNRVAEALARIGPAVRVAAITDLFKAQPNEGEALQEALKLSGISHLGQDQIQDFTFQFNRQCQFQSVPSQMMNRLVRWGVGSFQHFRVEIGAVPLNNAFGGISYVTSVFLDLNNVPSTSPLDFSQQMAMYMEMASEFTRLASAPSVERL